MEINLYHGHVLTGSRERQWETAGIADGVRRTQWRLGLAATVAFAILLAGVDTLGWRWYRYVTAGPTPYDEVGIEVNRRLPDLLRTWG